MSTRSLLGKVSRRRVLAGMATTAGASVLGFAAEQRDSDALRAAYREWLASLPAAPKPSLKDHGLVATELNRWHIMEANQGVAVDTEYF